VVLHRALKNDNDVDNKIMVPAISNIGDNFFSEIRAVEIGEISGTEAKPCKSRVLRIMSAAREKRLAYQKTMPSSPAKYQ